jgi:hypothetical protein
MIKICPSCSASSARDVRDMADLTTLVCPLLGGLLDTRAMSNPFLRNFQTLPKTGAPFSYARCLSFRFGCFALISTSRSCGTGVPTQGATGRASWMPAQHMRLFVPSL